MSLEIFHTDEYKDIMQDYLYNTITFLQDSGMEFSIAAEVRHLSFEPELPSKIRSSFDEVALFVISGYTFESCQVNEDEFSFEAGFGEHSIGATVSMPLLCIKQVFADNYPIAINISEPKRPKPILNTNRSMEALLRNPENKKLFDSKKR